MNKLKIKPNYNNEELCYHNGNKIANDLVA